MIRIGDSREEKGEREEMGHPSGNISMNLSLIHISEPTRPHD